MKNIKPESQAPTPLPSPAILDPPVPVRIIAGYVRPNNETYVVSCQNSLQSIRAAIKTIDKWVVNKNLSLTRQEGERLAIQLVDGWKALGNGMEDCGK